MKRQQAAAARLASLDDGVVRVGPRTLHVDVTNACNTDCITCWDHSPHLKVPRPASWKRQRVDASVVAALLDDAASLGGLEAVIVSGMGEPFTHPQIDEILAAVKARGLHLTVITNLAGANVERILELDVDQLLIGIHAASSASYLAFHPSFGPAHWDRLHAALGRFAAAGKRYKHVQVICATNAHELVEMIELASRYDAAQVNFKLASLKQGTEAVRVSDEQRRRLLDDGIAAAEARAQALGVVTNLRVFRTQLTAGGEATAPIEEIGCFLGYEYSRVTVDGTVLYCCNTEVVVGRFEQPGDFARLWRGEAWNGLRARLRGGRFFPGCHQCGKLNEVAKLSARFRATYGEERWNLARGGDAQAEAATVGSRRTLRVLP